MPRSRLLLPCSNRESKRILIADHFCVQSELTILLLSFNRAFTSRPGPNRLSDDALRRIQVAYCKAKADPRGMRSVYRVGNEWSPIY